MEFARIMRKTVVFAIYAYLILLAALFSPAPVLSEPNADQMLALNDAPDVFEMSLTQLMQLNVTVTSVSKRAQALHDTASAVYVLTQEDLRRSGVTSIPEALRMVPGVYVARVNNGEYVVTIRGMGNNEPGSSSGMNKLLVLVDGRSIYSPVFGGVIWQAVQDMMLEDIDRIEVIRGPGAALWGSNAVAGVINIITKSAKDTQGALVSAMGGTAESGGALRYGGKIDDSFSYRVYGKYRDQNPGLNSNNAYAYDNRQLYQGGFRGEWQASENNLYTLQGDVYEADVQTQFASEFVSFSPPYNNTITSTVPYRGDNVLGRWNRKLDDGASLQLQMYYDRTSWRNFNSGMLYLDQVDVEFQHNFQFWERNNASWGVNFRNSDLASPQTVSTNITNNNLTLAGFFLHDEITLLPKTWSVIAGAKFEYNSYTGMEPQPNIRTVWTPHPDHTFWAAASRAARIPEMVTRNFQFIQAGFPLGPPPAPTGVALVFGDGRTKSETLLAYEAGYRYNAIPEKLSFDTALFIDNYDHLIVSPVNPSGPSPLSTPFGSGLALVFPWTNAFSAKIYGGEVSVEYRPLPVWRLTGSYSYNYTGFYPTSSEAIAATTPNLYRWEPHFAVKGRSNVELPYDLEFDTVLSYQDQYVHYNIPAYAQLDLRLGWKPFKQLAVSLQGQNLLRDRRPEIIAGEYVSTETPRAFLGKLTWRW